MYDRNNTGYNYYGGLTRYDDYNRFGGGYNDFGGFSGLNDFTGLDFGGFDMRDGGQLQLNLKLSVSDIGSTLIDYNDKATHSLAGLNFDVNSMDKDFYSDYRTFGGQYDFASKDNFDFEWGGGDNYGEVKQYLMDNIRFENSGVSISAESLNKIRDYGVTSAGFSTGGEPLNVGFNFGHGQGIGRGYGRYGNTGYGRGYGRGFGNMGNYYGGGYNNAMYKNYNNMGYGDYYYGRNHNDYYGGGYGMGYGVEYGDAGYAKDYGQSVYGDYSTGDHMDNVSRSAGGYREVRPFAGAVS